MNAPARIAPARERYTAIVEHHLPHCSDKELQLRCSILLLKDKAWSHMRRCSDEAGGILGEIYRLATLYGLQSMPLSELEELRYRLLQMTQTASGLEQMAWRLANPGGTDARG